MNLYPNRIFLAVNAWAFGLVVGHIMAAYLHTPAAVYSFTCQLIESVTYACFRLFYFSAGPDITETA